MSETRGYLLPARRDPKTGRLQWAVPGIVDDLVDAITLPGDVYRDKVDPLGDEALRRAMDLAGMAVLGTVGRAGSSMLAAKGPMEYDAPRYPQRPFKADYPGEVPADATGKLQRDIEGRPLTARYVAGRVQAGQPDNRLGPDDLAGIGQGLLGRPVQTVPGRNLGGVGATELGPTGDPRAILLADDLHPDDVPRVLAHELGHAVDLKAGPIPNGGLRHELGPIYHAQATGQRWSAAPVTPQSVGYPDAEAPYEYMAEAIRNYLLDPNSIKSVAPETAARIRAYVNSHPEVSKTIQFNTAAPLVVGGGLGAAALAPTEAQGEVGMASNVPPPPAGFVLDTRPQASLAPPPGFVLQQQEAPEEERRRGGVLSPIVQGATLGFADEMAGAVRGTYRALTEDVPFGQAYTEERDRSRQMVDDAREDSPWLSTGAEIAGGIASGGGLVAAAPNVARTVLGLGGRTLAGKAGASAASGAALGAVGGFGAGEGGVTDHARSAALGTFTGATVGAAVPVAGAAIGRGVNAIASRVAGRGGPVSTSAANLIADDLADEGTTIAQVNARARELGPQAMLADASDALRLRAEQLANTAGPGRTAVTSAVRDRSAGARERIGSAYDATMGERPDVQVTLDSILERRAAEAGPLYQRAMQVPVMADDQMARMIKDPIMKEGIRRGYEIQRLEAIAKGEEFNPVDYRLIISGADGQPEMMDVPNMRTLQTAKTGLDAMITDSKDQFGRLTERGRSINAFRATYLRKLDEGNPTYAQARAAWEGPTRTLEAFENGRTIFGNRVHPDTLKRDFAQMSEAEREAYQLGTRAAVDEAMGRVRNGSLKGRQLLDSDFNERRILTVFGEDEGRKLIAVLNGEEAMAQTANQLTTNSATARRLQGNPFDPNNRTAAERAPGVLRNAANWKFGDAVATASERVMGVVEGRRRNEMGRTLGPFLTARGDERDKLVAALMASDARRAASTAQNPERDALVQAMLQGGALAYARP